MDLRERIAKAISSKEESYPLIAERYCVGVASVVRIARRVRQNETLQPRPRSGGVCKLTDKHHQWLNKQIEQQPFVSSYELSDAYNQRFPDNKVHRSTILRAIHQLGLSYKKNSICPAT